VLSDHPELARFLTYADPTGEEAARNIDRERRRKPQQSPTHS